MVDLPKFLVEEFLQYILHQKKEGLKEGKGREISLLFIDPEEKEDPFSQRKIQKTMQRVCKAAVMRGRRPHDL